MGKNRKDIELEDYDPDSEKTKETEVEFADGSGEYMQVPVKILETLDQVLELKEKKDEIEGRYKDKRKDLKTEFQERGWKKVFHPIIGRATLVENKNTSIDKDKLAKFLEENTDKTIEDFKKSYSYSYVQVGK